MLDLIEKKFDTGFTCYIIKKPFFKEKQAMFGVNYGSEYDNFSLNGKEYNMPMGIAHFLEHKLFEQKEFDVFEEFTKNGANSNAFTNFTQTAYYFNCTENFGKNLEILLKFVSEPGYTEKTVENEKKIISREIEMYEDDYEWCCYFNMLKGMFPDKSIRNNIAGTIASVNKITKSDLDLCYEGFYTMDNSVLVCCGDIDENETYEIIEKNLKLKEKSSAKLKESNDADIKSEYNEEKKKILQPILNLGFKDCDFSDTILNRICLSKISLDILFSKSSSLFHKLYNKGIITDNFSYDYNGGSDFGFCYFSASSKNPEAFTKYITEEIAEISERGINKSRIEDIRRKRLGSFIMSANSVSSLASSQLDFFSKGFTVTDVFNYYQRIDEKKLNKKFRELFNKKNMVLSIIKPEN